MIAVGRKTFLGVVLCLCGPALQAQADRAAASQPVDVAVMFNAERSQYSFSNNFWLYGGSGELGVHLRYGLSLVVNATGTLVSAASSGQSLSKIMTTAGPRYTVPLGHRSHPVFVEALFGGVDGFNGVFPSVNGAKSSTDAFAMQIGGGYDVHLSHTWTLRALDAHYVRTDLPNGFTNRQNDLLLGAGIVWRPVDRAR